MSPLHLPCPSTDHTSPAIAAGSWLRDFPRTAKLRRLTGDQTVVLWIGHGLAVISSAMDAEYQAVIVRHNHLSVAVPGHDRRPTDAELDQVRADFDMADAEEDNHSPGVARHLFLPLHLPRGTTGVCDCKTDETVVVEPDGYRWSRKKA